MLQFFGSRYNILIGNENSWIGLAIQSEGDNPTIHQNGFSIQIQSKKGLDFWIFFKSTIQSYQPLILIFILVQLLEVAAISQRVKFLPSAISQQLLAIGLLAAPISYYPRERKEGSRRRWKWGKGIHPKMDEIGFCTWIIQTGPFAAR